MTTLIFVDTVIYLDYYRVQGDASLSILDHFINYKDRIITTTQVEMEYKKNRQDVILESTKSIYKPPDSIVIPSFLRESHSKFINSAQAQLSKQTKELREKTAMLLREPDSNDPVYKSLQKFFSSKAPCHFRVNLDDNIKSEIEEKAQRRFLMGYPPRKAKDTSMGDAVNWEWIIYCANKFSANIIIVSRDGDYGHQDGNNSILNDWLQHEFNERVQNKYQITLTTKLTEAFKSASIRVTKKQEQSEQQLLNTITPNVTIAALFPNIGAKDVSITPVFAWPSATGANSYEFMLAEETGQIDKFATIDYSASTTVNFHKCVQPLKYNTTYNWGVRAVHANFSKSAWLVSFFKTMVDAH